MLRILITGGAGFVGSSLALMFKRDYPSTEVIAFDNLRRRGSELSLPRLKAGSVEFQHGDVRNREDFDEIGSFNLLVECSADPCVYAGYAGSPGFTINTNLLGTINTLEVVRRYQADLIFLSTSRVYPIELLRQLPLKQRGDRLVIADGVRGPGWSAAGITTEFPLTGNRSIYGATKLCSELLIEEYGAIYGLRAVINRCGVLAGAWQMGKVDQGFVALWAARHLYGGRLAYMGFGGTGLQVRDIMHVADLYDLIRLQIAEIDKHKGRVYNVGGGLQNSVSLAELTKRCVARSRCPIDISSDPETRTADVPYYVTDNAAVTTATGWGPTRSVDAIVDEIFAWLTKHRPELEPILA